MILLAGATGYIGLQLAKELSDAGYELLCPMRKTDTERSRRALAALSSLPRTQLIETDVTNLERLLADIKPIEEAAVISCLATRGGGPVDAWAVEYRANANLLAWATRSSARHFTLLSAICVQKPRLQFQFAKARFEGELRASGLSHSIVRPTAFFKSLCGQVDRVRKGKPFLMFGDGTLTACKPISERDLAHFLRRTLEEPEMQNRVLPIGGPGPAISPLDQAQMLARLTSQVPRTRSVNPVLLRAAAGVLSAPAMLSQRFADRAEFARIGHYYATESMLLWDEVGQCYDANATPEHGRDTLEEVYTGLLRGDGGQALGEHALFSRR